jgi:hypothetical protein
MAWQTLGLMSKFYFLDIWEYFPNIHLAEKSDGSGTVLLKQAYMFFVLGGIFIIFGIIDNWAFVFHPFLVNVVIDLKSKRKEDRRDLSNLADTNFESIITQTGNINQSAFSRGF